MRNHIMLSLFFVAFLSLVSTGLAQETGEPVVIGERFEVESEILGMEFPEWELGGAWHGRRSHRAPDQHTTGTLCLRSTIEQRKRKS